MKIKYSEKQDEIMAEVVRAVSMDKENGISRFLQANPYTSFEYYNLGILKDKVEVFENTLYYESKLSEINKLQICDILENPNGRNTFFIVGYQGCGKSTFIHSVINKYNRKNNTRVVLIDCDKIGTGTQQIGRTLRKVLRKAIGNQEDYINFLDFYQRNKATISEICNNMEVLYKNIKSINENDDDTLKQIAFNKINTLINSNLSLKDMLYILILWNLGINYNLPENVTEKLMIFVDNLDCVDEYSELSEFISCIDALTIDLSEIFDKLILSKDLDEKNTFVSKIKLFIAMRETTKANLPSSHFSDAFKSIYINKDMTEWYDKGEIIKHRINKLMKFDYQNLLLSEQRLQLKLILKVSEDIYTRNVIYPLFNNNYRSAVILLSNIITSNTEQFEMYAKLMDLNIGKYRHGARGILYKAIFDEFCTESGNEASCFKRIGVLDLLNRKNNSVSTCRLILSFLSNHTETKCDSGKNCISLKEIIDAFDGIFDHNEVTRILCEMFALRDSKWTHLISFNQIEYYRRTSRIESRINITNLNPDRTMIHYSCAGKIYIEYVSTHFEFFTSRISKDHDCPLFCNDNLIVNQFTKQYVCCEIIDRVFDEVKKCCDSLYKFNMELCDNNNFLNPYEISKFYLESPYVCMFKRTELDGKERRFKQFHEERIILAHISYIDYYRSYLLNHCNLLSKENKVRLNEMLTIRIERYVDLLSTDKVLKSPYTIEELITHFREQIKILKQNWENFETEISKNN